MKTIAILAAAAAWLFATDNQLAGQWQSRPDAGDGAVMGALFREDGSFEGSRNGRLFAYGNYALSNDTLSFTDNTCNGAEGKYKLLFFSNGDSLRLQAIGDDCGQRRSRIEGTVLGRVK